MSYGGIGEPSRIENIIKRIRSRRGFRLLSCRPDASRLWIEWDLLQPDPADSNGWLDLGSVFRLRYFCHGLLGLRFRTHNRPEEMGRRFAMGGELCLHGTGDRDSVLHV
jgi:hypothetical protein